MSLERYALAYRARGWPVLAIKPGSKEPLTRHGVKDSTTDVREIRRWFERWPDANLAIACGAPGPHVLDVDDLEAFARSGMAERLVGVPTVASARGRHFYFAGINAGTIKPGYGELLGRGAYALAPPSIHPSGCEYVWLEAPRGSLPPILEQLLRAGRRRDPGAGKGEQPLIPVGRRYDALVRFLGLLRSYGFGEAALVAFVDPFLDHAVELDEARVPLDRAHAYRTARRIARRYPPHPNRGPTDFAAFQASDPDGFHLADNRSEEGPSNGRN